MDHQMNKIEIIPANHIEHPKQHKMHNNKTKCHHKRKYITSKKISLPAIHRGNRRMKRHSRKREYKEPKPKPRAPKDPLTKHDKEMPLPPGIAKRRNRWVVWTMSLKNFYHTALQHHKYFWCAIDLLQENSSSKFIQPYVAVEIRMYGRQNLKFPTPGTKQSKLTEKPQNKILSANLTISQKSNITKPSSMRPLTTEVKLPSATTQTIIIYATTNR